jgi:hypothetical protein
MVQDIALCLGFVYKKLKPIPGKADAEDKRAFIEAYRTL